jgi:hypothetical protein
MAESSLPWAGAATGDCGPYSDDQWSDTWRKLFLLDRTTQGVLLGYGNTLAVTGATSPVAVNTGAALVDGKFYENTASVNVAIPTPAGATRIDRIVLRKDFAGQTVRITRIAGTEGAGAPAITQTDGTTWDIPLAQASITTGGIITVTDERSFASTPLAQGGKTRLSLPPSAGFPPDDSSGSAAAQIQMKLTTDATDPQVRWPELLFDATTEEHWYWSFAMPSNYGSAPIVDVYYKATSAVAGTAAFNAKLMAVTPGDAADVDADEFAAEQTAGSETVPGTAGFLSKISIPLTNADSVAANDLVVLAVFRDVSVDGVAGDLEVPMVVLRYTGA